MTLDQVLQALGVTMELGKNFAQIVRGPNVWPLIVDRETAIKALEYDCDKGPPFIVVRTIRPAWKGKDGTGHPREIWYEIGSTGHEQELGFDLPAGLSGFPKRICIEAGLAETLIAEGVLWIQGDVDEEQTHCYYTGSGSYYEKNKEKLVPYVNECIARRRREILANHTRARILESVVLERPDLISRIRQGYEKVHLVIPSNEAIRAEVERVLGATPVLLAEINVGGRFVYANAPYQVKAPDGKYFHVGPIGNSGIECRLPLDTTVIPL